MHVRRVESERSVHCGPSQSRCLVSPRTKLVAGDSAATTMARGEAPRPAARTKRPVLFGSFLGLLLMAALRTSATPTRYNVVDLTYIPNLATDPSKPSPLNLRVKPYAGY